jgi:transposase
LSENGAAGDLQRPPDGKRQCNIGVYHPPGPTDLRKSFDGLSGLVRARLEGDPLSGDLFVFCNRCKNRLKILYFDSTGLWVFAKRLERGTFAWPQSAPVCGRLELRYEELLLLLGGLDTEGGRERRHWRRRAS